MAKFTVVHTIHVGDRVSFIDHHGDHDEVQMGIVQDISQLPDVFVEGFCNSDNRYTRWRKDIDNLTIHDSEYEDYGRHYTSEFEKDERVEFIHDGDVGTREFYNLKYRKLGTQEFVSK